MNTYIVFFGIAAVLVSILMIVIAGTRRSAKNR
jgi:hypothetical protein